MPYEVNGLYHLHVRKTTSVVQKTYLLVQLRNKNYLFSDDTRLFFDREMLWYLHYFTTNIPGALILW